MQIIKLNDQELSTVSESFRKGSPSYRILYLISQNPDIPTDTIRNRIGIPHANISDLVTKLINPRLWDYGLQIGCIKPPTIAGKRKYLWSLYRFQDVAVGEV